MSFSTEHNIPFDLIIADLQGDPAAGEQLKQWLSDSEKNQELYHKAQQVWENDIADYNIYKSADANVAWTKLLANLEAPQLERTEAKVIGANFRSARVAVMRWASVAAVVIFAVGLFIWYNTLNKGSIYETGIAQERTIELIDGSTIRLYANSKITVNSNYNKSERIITFEKGAAFFEVIHNEKVPFKVDMPTATVRDIGTSFHINNTKDSINVTVKTGKVSFTAKQDSENRELTAGMILKYLPADNNASQSISIDSTEAVANRNALHFNDTPLSEVLTRFQKSYGKKLILQDSALSQRLFTGNLDGVEFAEAINVLTRSLDIKYSEENNVYYLK